jgi:uncharacterized protein DUF5666
MKAFQTALLVLVLLVPSLSVAHEGHSHERVMGTVSRLEKDRMIVKTSGGSTVSILISDDTRYRGKDGDSSRDELKVGDRVVVKTMHQGDTLAADEIRFSSRPSK